MSQTLEFFNKNQFEFEVAYFLPHKNQMVDELTKLGVRVSCLNKRNNFKILTQRKELFEYIQKGNFDLVHAHLPWAGIVGRFWSKSKSKLIYTEHNSQERYHLLTRFVNKWTFNRQREAIGVSGEVITSIRENIKPGIPINLVWNGVNTSKFNPSDFESSAIRKRLGIDENCIVIGNVSVFRKQKRLNLWLEIASKIQKDFPEVKFVLIGSGPESKNIREVIKKFGLYSVIMPGKLSEIREWLAIMDIFLISSKYEGLPVALLEAMSMKIPVVSTSAGGIKEVVRDGTDGLIYPISEWHKLFNGVTELIGSHEKRIQMGENARERVVEKFSIHKMVSDLEQIYARIYDENKRGQPGGYTSNN